MYQERTSSHFTIKAIVHDYAAAYQPQEAQQKDTIRSGCYKRASILGPRAYTVSRRWDPLRSENHAVYTRNIKVNEQLFDKSALFPH